MNGYHSLLELSIMEPAINWTIIRNGDEKAFARLYEMLYYPLCSIAWRIINDRQVAQEIVQDVFSKIWNDRAIIEIHTSLNSYLSRCVRNSALNELKRRQTNKGSSVNTTSVELWKLLLETRESNDFIIEQIISEDLQKKVNRAVESLPPQCREVFQLSRQDNKTNDEIAGILKISKNTVKSHLANALKRISSIISKEK